jgi:hypothetical protein
LLIKKKLVAPLLILAIILSGFIPVTQTQTFKINAPFFNIYQQINSPANWLKWRQGLKSANSNSTKIDSSKNGFQIKTPLLEINLKTIGIGEFAVVETKAGTTKKFDCTFIAETNTERTTCITKARTNVFGYLSALIKRDDHSESPFFEMKNYLEDPRLYYGFAIEKRISKRFVPGKQCVKKRSG